MRIWLYVGLFIGLAVCLIPLIAGLWAMNFAKRHGCGLHEGFVQPCVVAGTDWGDILSSAFVSMWLLMVTGPIALVLACALLALALRDLLRYMRRDKGA